MSLTSSKIESDSDSGSEFEDEVFYKLSRYDLINLIQDLMGRCQEKSKHMKILRKQNDLLK